MDKKKCSKCKELKDRSEFWKNKNKKDGLHSYCRSCCKEGQDRRKREIKKLNEGRDIRKETLIKFCRGCNTEKSSNEFHINREVPDGLDNRCKVCRKLQRANHKDWYTEYSKKYWEENKEREKEKWQVYYANNYDYMLKRNRKYRHKRGYSWIKVDKLDDRMSHSIRIALRGNKGGRHWEDLVSYTLDELKKHLIFTLPSGYTWQDYLDGFLHIDHIIPKYLFEYTDYADREFKQAWALANLRLLPAKENLKKGRRANATMEDFKWS